MLRNLLLIYMEKNYDYINTINRLFTPESNRWQSKCQPTYSCHHPNQQIELVERGQNREISAAIQDLITNYGMESRRHSGINRKHGGSSLMLGSLLKTLRPSVAVSEEIVIKEDETSLVDSLSIEEDFDIPDLNNLHRSLERAQRNDEIATLAPFLHGPDWDKLLTNDQARKYVDNWLDDNGLEIGQSSFNLLSENRRRPYSDYAVKARRLKGNRHIYGRLPHIQGAKQTIFQLVLDKWLEEHVKPHAKPLKEVA